VAVRKSKLTAPDLQEREAELEDYRLLHAQIPSNESWLREAAVEHADLWRAGGLFGSTLVESVSGVPVSTLMAGFVTPEFSYELSNGPASDASAVAARWVRDGRRPVYPPLDVDARSIASEAAREGLHMHVFHFDYRGPASGLESMRARTMVAERFVERYRGACLRAMTFECYGENYIEGMARSGCREFNRSWKGDMPVAIMGVDRALAELSGNTAFMGLFSHGLPDLPLNHRQRRVLFHFRNGLTDPEIAERIYVSQNSMKTTWDRIFEIFNQHVPSVFESKFKRRAIIEYLRTHPEEVWPSDVPLH
jgi:DNA-binding CsgD family transcriptional regulator